MAARDENIIIKMLYGLQEYMFMLVELVATVPKTYKYRKDLLHEMYLIGAQSFPLIFFGGIFMGIILSLEIGYRFETFGAKMLVGRAISLGMIRELGPVISGLLLASRTGAKNTSEIGAMVITEQVDALAAFGINPVAKLVLPRTLASIIMFFPLVGVADVIGMIAAMYTSNIWLNIDTSMFWISAFKDLQLKDLFVGFAKPVMFGFFISTISCWFGLRTMGGTRGLGRSTINTVVTSSLVILIIDLVMTKIVWELL